MEFKKRDLFVEDKSEEGIVKKVLSKLKNVRDRAQSEIKEKEIQWKRLKSIQEIPLCLNSKILADVILNIY